VLDEVEDGAVGGLQRVDVGEVAAEVGGAALEEVDAVCCRMRMFVGVGEVAGVDGFGRRGNEDGCGVVGIGIELAGDLLDSGL